MDEIDITISRNVLVFISYLSWISLMGAMACTLSWALNKFNIENYGSNWALRPGLCAIAGFVIFIILRVIIYKH